MSDNIFSIIGGIILLALVVGTILVYILPDYNKKRKQRIRELATVIRKETYDVQNRASRSMSYYTSHEVTFQLPDKEKTFIIDPIFYNRLQIGNRAMLEYTNYGDFISFGDFIKEEVDKEDELPSRI